MRNEIIEQIIKDIDLSDEIKEKVKERYEDLGNWLNRSGSTIAKYQPYIFPQGSFLLQTAIRPITKEGEYDLDIGCKLLSGLSTVNITQKELKEKLRVELESYRTARNIKNPLEEKKRCWRLEYQDKMSFHIDIVPCIPAQTFDSTSYGPFYVEMYKEGDQLLTEANIQTWKLLSLLITDNESKAYSSYSDNWHHSNPEGFAKWFKARAALSLVQTMNESSPRNEIEDLPITTGKSASTLQLVVKVLKRHRDVMFAQDDTYAPISVIISKLAADAYKGEVNLAEALMNVIAGMRRAVITPISNPTEPREDYTDKWKSEERYYRNFIAWITQAEVDFGRLVRTEITQAEAKVFLDKKLHLDFTERYRKLIPEYKEETPKTPQPFHITEPKAKPWRK